MDKLAGAVGKMQLVAKVAGTEVGGGGDDGEDMAEGSPTIKVCVRVRPFIKEELEGGRSGGVVECCIEMPTKTSVVMTGKGPEPKVYEFDRCYWSHSADHPLYATQETLYQEQGIDMINKAMKGYNNCIFAYGQTGSGKSFSVVGGKKLEDQGLLPRVVTGLFERFTSLPPNVKKLCKVSFLEVYNEQINDLLADKGVSNEVDEDGSPVRKKDQKLEVRQSPTLGTFIPGLCECPVESRDEVMALVDYGMTLRAVSATAMNATSSRSHCMFSFKTNIEEDGKAARSQTHLVDLAGSERAGRTKASGDRLKEGAAINQSLSALARVISELAKMADKKNKKKINVPWRQSKLTFILKDSLSGNSMTAMMAAISPNMPDYEETVSTMQFCQTVKMVQTSGKKNLVGEGGTEALLKAEIEKLRAEVAELLKEKEAREQLLVSEQNPGEQRKSTLARLEARRAIMEDGDSTEMQHLRNWYETLAAAQEGDEDAGGVAADVSEDDEDSDEDEDEGEDGVFEKPKSKATVSKEEIKLDKQVDKAKEEFERMQQELQKDLQLQAEMERERAEREATYKRRASAEDGGEGNEAEDGIEVLPEETEEERQERERKEQAILEAAEERKQQVEEMKVKFQTNLDKKCQQLWKQMEGLVVKLQESEKELSKLNGGATLPVPSFFEDFMANRMRVARKQSYAHARQSVRKSQHRGKSSMYVSSGEESDAQKCDLQHKMAMKDLDDGKLAVNMTEIMSCLHQAIDDTTEVMEIIDDISDLQVRKTDLRVLLLVDPENAENPMLLIKARRYMPGELKGLVSEEYLNPEDFSNRLDWLEEQHKKARIEKVKNEMEDDLEDDGSQAESDGPQYNRIGDAWALSAVGNTADEKTSCGDSESIAPDSPEEGGSNLENTNAVYISNLSSDVTKENLRSLFESCGSVIYASILTDNFTGTSKGSGTVIYANARGKMKAVSELHNKEFMGRVLQVKWAGINADASMTYNFDVADEHLSLADAFLHNIERRKKRQKKSNNVVLPISPQNSIIRTFSPQGSMHVVRGGPASAADNRSNHSSWKRLIPSSPASGYGGHTSSARKTLEASFHSAKHHLRPAADDDMFSRAGLMSAPVSDWGSRKVQPTQVERFHRFQRPARPSEGRTL